ncbi:MAG: hypothetical protein ACRD1M_04685 [Terriglobales bacterium]
MQRTMLVIAGLMLLMVLAVATPVQRRVQQATAPTADRILRAVEQRFPTLQGLGTVLSVWSEQTVSAAPISADATKRGHGHPRAMRSDQ